MTKARAARTGGRIALVCLTPKEEVDGAPYESPSYGVRRIQAAIVADPELAPAWEVVLFDSRALDVEGYVERIEAFDPDIVGFSVYVWSFPTLYEVARRLHQNRPDRTLVFGGPSARPAMFSLPPFRDSLSFVDAIVIREGEDTFRELVALEDRSPERLATVRGLGVPSPGGWVETPERPLLEPLDRIASPYQHGLMPTGQFGYLETYRGCPLHCTFCEWGISGNAQRVFSTEYLVHELRALEASNAMGAFDLDAGLNLNTRAFRNLREAEAEVGFFRKNPLVCEVYPSLMSEDYFDFLTSVNPSYIGVGLQSFNQAALRDLQRQFVERNFETVVERLAEVGTVEIQLILGLPGDDPVSFRKTVERARKLPAQVRVYHCLVLPDALMTRSPAAFALDYDPVTLRMRSCLGWSERDLEDTRAFLASESDHPPTDYWFSFEPTRRVRSSEPPPARKNLPVV